MSLYIDQTIKVFANTDNPENGVIRIHFSDVTLSLKLVDASWLATLIQMEIRKVENEHPELETPTSDNILVGDKVIVRYDDGRHVEHVVRRKPWKLDGQWVIGLIGVSGGYPLDRVIKFVSRHENEVKT